MGLADSNPSKRSWEISGPHSSGHEAPGLTAALKNLHQAESRAPTENDRPPASTFPMTAAARAALELDREADKRLKPGKRARTYGAA
jgi:hypothetical protein